MNPKISLFLRRIGLRATLTGFHYLAYALSLVLQDETYLLHLTTRLCSGARSLANRARSVSNITPA